MTIAALWRGRVAYKQLVRKNKHWVDFTDRHLRLQWVSRGIEDIVSNDTSELIVICKVRLSVLEDYLRALPFRMVHLIRLRHSINECGSCTRALNKFPLLDCSVSTSYRNIDAVLDRVNQEQYWKRCFCHGTFKCIQCLALIEEGKPRLAPFCPGCNMYEGECLCCEGCDRYEEECECPEGMQNPDGSSRPRMRRIK